MPHPDSDTALLKANAASPSPARLAAESAFSIVTTIAPTTDDRPVVIVRRRRVAVDGEYEDRSHDGRDQNEATRPPRVYRVDSGPFEGSKEPAAEPGVANTSGGDAPGQDNCLVVSRRPRRSKHGGVTIMRPALPAASELAEQTRKAKQQYERIKAEIRKLDRQIEAARQVEVGKAVRWICKAIAEYGLEAKDLGLF